MSSIGFKPKDINITKSSSVSNIIKPNFTHACIIGETGSGKTSSMINPNLLNRLKLDHGVLVFDHKGNYHTTVKALAKRVDRLEDVVVIGMPWDKKCNIIEDMDESSFVEFINGIVKHSPDNLFWEQSAVSLAISIMKVIVALERLNNFEAYKPVIKDLVKSYSKSIKSLHSVTTSAKSIKKFSSDIEDSLIDSHYNKTDKIVANLITKVEKDNNKEAKEAIKAYIDYEKSYKSFKKEVIDCDLFDSSQSKTYDNILLSLNGPIGALSSINYINYNEININDALNSGKIVIFICNQLPPNALTAITRSIFKNFNERIGQNQLKDISIFIDEAQRVLSPDMDLPIDTLREARVDVFMAFQSKSLLMNKIGILNTEALYVNLTSRYYLKNKNNDDDIESENLEPFTFLTNKDNTTNIHKAKPIFIDKKELFNVEYEYQKLIKATNSYKDYLPSKRRPYILRFIPSLYAKGKITLCYKNEEIKNFNFSKEVSLKNYKELKDRLSQHIDDRSDGENLSELAQILKAQL